MEKGTLRKVTDFYATQNWFEEEVSRAFVEFFGLTGYSEAERIEIDEMGEGLFNEWLLFDFKLSNDKTLLKDYIERNPHELDQSQLKIYEDLIDTNKYGFFEVKRVRLAEGLTLYDLNHGETYKVKERSATFQLKPGNLFYARVAKVEDHWELVGANGPVLPVKLSPRYRKIFRNDPKNKLSPKDAYQLIDPGCNPERIEEKKMIDPERAQSRLKSFLEAHRITEYVAFETVLEWLKLTELKSASNVVSMLFGLVYDRLDKSGIDNMVEAVSDVFNSSPLTKLGGKSPQEKWFDDPKAERRFIMDVNTIGGEEWLKHLEKYDSFMKAGEYKKALMTINKTFESLIKEQTTRPDIYRMFANKAICHFALGQEEEGIKMVELALDLNPNYDFAQKLKFKYEQGKFEHVIAMGALKSGAELVANDTRGKGKEDSSVELDPAVSYFYFLRNLKINFATKRRTKSKLTTFGRPY